VLSQAPRQADASMRCSDTAATIAHRLQHADEAANKHVDKVASPRLPVFDRDQWPWPLERACRSSSPVTITQLCRSTPLLPSPTRPRSFSPCPQAMQHGDFPQQDICCNFFCNKSSKLKNILQQEFYCNFFLQHNICYNFFCNETCVAKGFSQLNCCKTDKDALT
jgi:hypothetical protein